MKYEKNQYSEGVSICSLIIAGMFVYWGLNDLVIRPLTESRGVSWWGFIWLGIGASIAVGQVAAWLNRSRLRNAVLYEYEANPTAAIEDISQTTGITFRDVQAIVLDLKARGLLRGKFSSTTGEMKHVDVTTPNPPIGTKEDKVSYCPNCGTAKVKGTSVYCSYCGTKL
ncbi:MAG: zinc ribbon domain-containing protein [Anaerolineaceae bacterium]|nr:zinc ribbon domain-containing protein [Anaerolineaceae bacterium]